MPISQNDPNGQGLQAATGQRIGTDPTDPIARFWNGSSTPGYMQTQLSPASQAGFVSGLNGQASGAQGALLQQLMAQAQGKGPSLATQQLQQSTDQNMRQQAALAAGGRNPAAASYQAMQNAGSQAQQFAGQAAMARTQEQLNAQGALAGLTGQMQGNALAQAGLNQDVNLFNAGAQNQFGLAQGQMNQQANQFYNQMMAGQQGAYNQYLQNKDLQTSASNDALRNQLIGGAVGGASNALAQGIGALASDKRGKTDVRDPHGLIRQFLSQLDPADYRYKNTSAPGAAPGRHAGVMAQDLERSELGRRLVRDTSSGKMVDYGPHAVSTLLAALADMHKRVEALESKKKAA